MSSGVMRVRGSGVMRVRLRLRQIRVLGVVSDAPFELVVEVCSAVRRPRRPGVRVRLFGGPRCAGRKSPGLEVSGRRVALLWSRRRLVRGGGDRFLEQRPEFEGAVTARLARRPAAGAGVMPVRRAARRHRIGRHKVNALAGVWAQLVAERRRSRSCRVLLVDEASMRKRRRHAAVIVNAGTGQTLAMAPTAAQRP